MYTHFTFTLMAHCTSGAIMGFSALLKDTSKGNRTSNLLITKRLLYHCTTDAPNTDLPSVCQDCEVLMYADDTVIFGWGKNNVEVVARLTKVMVDVSDWLNKCCLQLNNSKT